MEKLVEKELKRLNALLIAEQEAIIQKMAYYDFLTGLPNRHTFSDRIAVALSEAKRNKHMLAVTLIDLDRFKQINDTWEYEMGDKG